MIAHCFNDLPKLQTGQPKCRAAIEKLRADNMLLKEELMLENKFSVQPTTANAAALIATLQDQSDQYTRKVWRCPATMPFSRGCDHS